MAAATSWRNRSRLNGLRLAPCPLRSIASTPYPFRARRRASVLRPTRSPVNPWIKSTPGGRRSGGNREQVVERIVRSGPVLAAGHVEGRGDLPLMRGRPVLLGRECRNHREERRGGDRARESDPVAHPPTHDGLAPWGQAEADMPNRRD